MQRQASNRVQPFCSTVRISIKLSTLKISSQRRSNREQTDETIEDYDFQMDCIAIENIRLAFREFLAFFYRHKIQICFAGSIGESSLEKIHIDWNKTFFNSFIKSYSWKMLLSLGHRFQQQVEQEFVDYLRTIDDDDSFYQLALYVWRRAKEYHFLNVNAEVNKYFQYLKEVGRERETSSSQICPLVDVPRNIAYVPSVTITPSCIYVKPLKLAKTNRVIREPKFGGPLNFCLG